MNQPTPKKPVAWSYSALNQFITCPKQYSHVRVYKDFKDPPNEQTRWGERVHKIMELALTQGAPVDADVPELARIADAFRTTRGDFSAERELAINSSYQPTDWWAPDAWCRGKLDAIWIDGTVARIVDWKTGRRKPNSSQLRLFALLVFSHYPDVERVTAAFVWLQTGAMDVETFHRKDTVKLWQEFLPDVRRLEYAFQTQTFMPKPSGLCRAWCPVTSCTFNGKVRDHVEEPIGES